MSNEFCTPQWRVFGNTSDLQTPFDVSVVMPSIGRRDIIKAVESIYLQENVGRVQVLIGIDKPQHDFSFLYDFLGQCPKSISVNVLYPGYSTSVRHGGVILAKDGGALRASLTHLANSKYVAYLDDDNWWGNNHLSTLLNAVKDKAWAYSLRYFVHPITKTQICIDEWESVGPGKGVFHKKFGGFVDPNCLIINKFLCWQCISLWNLPLNGDEKGMSADRNIFNFLKNFSEPGSTGIASAFYVLDPKDGMHSFRISVMRDRYDKCGITI